MEERQTNWRQIRLFAIVTVLLTAGGYVLLAIIGERFHAFTPFRVIGTDRSAQIMSSQRLVEMQPEGFR